MAKKDKHSENYYRIKDFFDRGLFNIRRIEQLAEKGVITEAERDEIITGERAE